MAQRDWRRHFQEPPRAARRRRRLYTLLSLALLLIAAGVYLANDITRVSLTPQHSTYPAGTAEITCTWRNGMVRTVWFDDPYTLERLEADGWREMPLGLSFQMPLYGLGPFAGMRKTLSLGAEPLPPGAYRVAARYWLNEGLEDPVYTAYAYFSIE